MCVYVCVRVCVCDLFYAKSTTFFLISVFLCVSELPLKYKGGRRAVSLWS